MATPFRIDINVASEILANPPPEFRRLNLIFAPFAVRLGTRDYPAAIWTDFAGVFLFRWWLAVWRLAEGKSRYARLPFWYTYEMWLRRTMRPWWRLSLVERYADSKNVVAEALVIPESLESALLTAAQKLLAGAKHAGVWTEDCAALDALLTGRESYLEGLEAGAIRPPAFLSGRLSLPAPPGGEQWRPSSNPLPRNGPSPPRSNPGLHQPSPPRINSPPILCPRCGAVLRPWEAGLTRQVCAGCGERITL